MGEASSPPVRFAFQRSDRTRTGRPPTASAPGRTSTAPRTAATSGPSPASQASRPSSTSPAMLDSPMVQRKPSSKPMSPPPRMLTEQTSVTEPTGRATRRATWWRRRGARRRRVPGRCGRAAGRSRHTPTRRRCAPEQVGEPFEAEARPALTPSLDEPVGVEEHPVPGLQLDGLDGGRSDLQTVEAERRTGRAAQLADDGPVADQDRWRMPRVGPCEGPGRRRQLRDLGGDEVTGEVDSDRLVGGAERSARPRSQRRAWHSAAMVSVDSSTK